MAVNVTGQLELVVFGGTGANNDVKYNDVWYTSWDVNTSKLNTWVGTKDPAPWSKRSDMAACTWENEIWMAGGHTVSGVSGGVTNDVWSSQDGGGKCCCRHGTVL